MHNWIIYNQPLIQVNQCQSFCRATTTTTTTATTKQQQKIKQIEKIKQMDNIII